jgi:16S rRNA (guanine(966)-N(2))-methyltransferase RsmD
MAPRLPGSSFLDLFAGTGAVGIEALSRGAQRAVFVEASPQSLKFIHENLRMLGWEKRAIVHRADVVSGLLWLRDSFDIIFLGPPYKDEKKQALMLTSPTLRHIVAAGILKPGGWIVGQHHIKEPVVTPPQLTLFREEKYGDTVVSFYTC